MISPTSVLITGASSGIGAALALAYAEPGRRLALTGRHEMRLATVAERCREAGATVATRAVDVTDRDTMEAWIEDMAATARLDLIIANAGISGGSGHATEEGSDQVRRIFAVNVGGVLNTVLPAIPVLYRQAPVVVAGSPPWRGQIAIVSSLAGMRGFPGAPAYSASKAAVKAWGEGLRPALARDQIAVSVICPGFIRTPMTADNPFPMPFLMEADRAAALIKKRLARNPARITFPFSLYALSWLASTLPPGWIDPLLSRMPEKPPRNG
jgi:NAD(P)-dependent dehydrogenase (short-subunit alcohol dehydrogenase family)